MTTPALQLGGGAAIPEELRARQQWAAWGKGSEPKAPWTTAHHMWNKREPLLTYEAACALAATEGFVGVGYRLSADDPFAVIDLDWKKRDLTERQIPFDMQREIDRFPEAYTEWSRSLKGVHIVVCSKPNARSGRREDGCELYDRDQFIALTGDVLPGRTELRDYDAAVKEYKAVHKIGDPQPIAIVSRVTEKWNTDLTDDEVLVLAARRDARFLTLFYTNDLRPGEKNGESNSEPAFDSVPDFVLHE